MYYNGYHADVHKTTTKACSINEAVQWQKAARAGRKVDAIKILRAATGLGLKEAKDAVEYWLENEPEYAHINPGPKVWEIVTGQNTKRRVTENGNGTYTLEIVTVVQCRDLGELLKYSMSL